VALKTDDFSALVSHIASRRGFVSRPSRLELKTRWLFERSAASGCIDPGEFTTCLTLEFREKCQEIGKSCNFYGKSQFFPQGPSSFALGRTKTYFFSSDLQACGFGTL
jgi:hypothetical protein